MKDTYSQRNIVIQSENDDLRNDIGNPDIVENLGIVKGYLSGN